MSNTIPSRNTLAALAIGLSLASAADPAKAPQKDEKAAKEEKRPTTKEEFAALAKEGPRPPWLPFRGQGEVNYSVIDGTVVDVSREFIEVQLKGKKETAKYPPHTLLDTGAVCHWEIDSRCYLLDDVKKGDVVVLAVGTVDKERGPECLYVSIRQRPGGVIPASRKPSTFPAYHQNQQARIDHAEKGIPLPDYLKPKRPEPGDPPPKQPPAGDPKKKD